MRHRAATTPSFLQLIRDTAMARRRNQRARAAVTVVATVAALTLVSGMAPAYADDLAPVEPAATETTESAPAVEPNPAPEPDPAPEPEPDPEPQPGPQEQEQEAVVQEQQEEGVESADTQQLSPQLTKKGGGIVALADAAPVKPSPPWQLDGNNDAGYGSAKENTAPATWALGGSSAPKDDFIQYFLNVSNSGDVIVNFGFTRQGTNGVTAFSVEANQKANLSDTPARPDRTLGDLLMRFEVGKGNADLTFVSAWLWTSSAGIADHKAEYGAGMVCEPMYGDFFWCQIPIDNADFSGSVTDEGFTALGTINITELFKGRGCSAAFSTVNIRSVASSKTWNPDMHDYINPISAPIASTCSNLVIKKYDAATGGNLITGAHFDVYAGTGTGGTKVYSDVFDGKPGVDADLDPDNGEIKLADVEPGTYTVKETVQPAGFFPPSNVTCGVGTDNVPVLCSILTETVLPKGTATYEFHNQRQWQALTVDKTAQGTSTATYPWRIEKYVGLSADGPWQEADTDATALVQNVSTATALFFYKVAVTQDPSQVTGIQVTGTIRVQNPNDGSVVVDLTEAMPGATSCTITGGAADRTVQGKLAGDAYEGLFGYTCVWPDSYAGALPTSNTATIKWDKAAYPQAVPDIGQAGQYEASTGATNVPWAQTDVNKTVTITDDKLPGQTWPTGATPWTITGTAAGGTHEKVYSRPIGAAAGSCSPVDTNIATVDLTTGTDPSDVAKAKVCRGADLTVAKDADPKLTRTYLWDIKKDLVTQGTVMVNADGSATVPFKLTLKADGSRDGDAPGWRMSGGITVTNPNDWQDITISTLTDLYSGGAADACTIDNWATENKVIPRSGSEDYTYTCVFKTKPSYTGTNTATVTWTAATAHTPSGSASSIPVQIVESDWDLDPEINKSVQVWDNNAGLTEPELIGTYGPWTATFSQEIVHTVTIPAEDAPADGQCKTYTNIATVNALPVAPATGQGSQLDDPASKVVKVCNPADLTVSKTAFGFFDRSYQWSIEKQVRANDNAPWAPTATSGPIDVWSHEFDYRVLLSEAGWDDRNFVIEGAITVTNTNTDDAIPAKSSLLTEAPQVGVGTECRVDTDPEGGPGDGTLLTNYSTGDIPSGGSKTIGYECTLSGDAPAYSGPGVKNVVTATSTTTGSAEAPVAFTKRGELNKTVTVTDNKVTLPVGSWAELGTKTYDESDADPVTDGHQGHVYPFTYELTHTATKLGCDNTFTNTATATSGALLDLVVHGTDSTTATVCPNPPKWTVSKTSDSDGPVPVGKEITYTLTVKKTGGVNPTNVLVVDDLSGLVDHVSIPATFAPSTGTVTRVGNTLEWTIPELSGSATLTFTVKVDSDAYGVDLPNLITSPGSQNCPDKDPDKDPTTPLPAECTTNSDTPAYTLDKSVAADEPVLPPYLGAPGDTVTYTLTVKNTSDAPINQTTLKDAMVSDNLTDVLDDATLVPGSITGPGTTAIRVVGVGDAQQTFLDWTLPEIPAGGEVKLTYDVVINDGAWDRDLVNVATPGLGGECVEQGGCTTTTETPPATQLQVKKVNAETSAPLAGAEFALHADLPPLADPADPEIGAEDIRLGDATSGADGLALFAAKLLKGQFLVKETKVPEGYGLPIGGDTMVVVIDDVNFRPNGIMEAVVFRDPALGDIEIVKEQYERNAQGQWELSDGLVDYGDEIRYVVHVRATGPKLFHDVTLTDYVPGHNPLDTVTTTVSALVAGSPVCLLLAILCDVTEGADNMLTWELGTLSNETRSVEFVTRVPEIPADPVYDANGNYDNIWWNQAYLAWQEDDFAPAAANQRIVPGKGLASNEVVAKATAKRPVVDPPKAPEPPKKPAVAGPLPSTGGPAAWLPLTGLGLVVLGAWLLLETRPRRRRS